MCFRCVARTGKRIYFAKLLKNIARGNHNVAAKSLATSGSAFLPSGENSMTPEELQNMRESLRAADITAR
jgi:hypothetical protein